VPLQNPLDHCQAYSRAFKPAIGVQPLEDTE
jgi:hypothetical protein